MFFLTSKGLSEQFDIEMKGESGKTPFKSVVTTSPL